MTINYEELLRKYMAHVIDIEGVSFLEFSGPGTTEPVVFTAEEREALSLVEGRLRTPVAPYSVSALGSVGLKRID